MKLALNNIRVVAQYTYKELMQSKILFNVIILGIILLLVSLAATQFTYGVPQRVALDIGLGCLSLSSMAIAVFLGSNLVKKEMESRTLYMILSRPIKRWQFIVGKVVGLVSVLKINLLLLSLITLSLYLILGGEFKSLILWAIFFNILEASLILLVVVFFSLVTNQVIAILITTGLIFAGHAINESIMTGFANRVAIIKPILNLYHFLFPAFYKLNLKDFVIHKQSMPLDFLLKNTLYAVIYGSAVLLGSVFVFNRKNLD